MSEFFVTLDKIIKELHLEELYVPKSPDKIKIKCTDVNRPGLQIAGFFDYFDNNRIQVMGKVEFTFLEKCSQEQRRIGIERLISSKVPAIIITRELEPFPEMIEFSEKYQVPLLRTAEATSNFMASLIAFLNLNLAPRKTIHGVLVEVYGEGILIIGESGVGKSETAIELVKRGHRLIADDAVEIKRVSNISCVGSSPAVIRHFIELRGIGIIDVRRIFGMGAVKESEKIDLIVKLESWDVNKTYDRLGMDNNYTDILGIQIPSLTIPVKPGRNLAIILEVAAMNNRQKRFGYNAAVELNNRLMEDMKKHQFESEDNK